jgi:hypothetical protein
VQTTHWWVEVLQTGVPPEHWTLLEQPGGTHWPPGVVMSQRYPPEQPWVSVQTTHWPVAVLQMGVPPEHWVLEVQVVVTGTHWPVAVEVLQV